MIGVRNVLVQAGGRVILDIPLLDFEEGKRYGLIGENGSGKTTLLRVLAGTLQPTHGEVSRQNPDGLGYMPQSPYAFSFSVLRNVEMALENAPDRREKAACALEAVGMQNFLTARGNKLSGGEAQRMAVARMIAKPRQLLLLDEPTSSTDIRGTDSIENTLLDYTRSTRCTLIFSTHSPAQALRLAEEVIFLDQGRILEKGSAREVLETPQTESARLFLQHWRI
ncbi:MAG TPA: ABC transporter ATP-binding protein [Anaerolineaceae bacterium]|nr:ABC transporter ATP-binding protein [Anaerolineaceae bacterium]